MIFIAMLKTALSVVMEIAVRKRLLTALFLLPLNTLLAEDDPSTNLELTLRVKPTLCLRYSTGESCKLTIEVIWRDIAPSSYCLHSQQDLQPLQCWTSSKGEMLTDDREMSEDLIYWLSKPGEPDKLVTATVAMATVVEDEKRTRTRRRHIWNLI